MGAQIACVARSGREARPLLPRLARRAPGDRLEPFSLAGYLAAGSPPSLVVLCPPPGTAAGLAFLERASRRLLWPGPPSRLDRAIGGLRGGDEPARGIARRRPARQGGGTATALLLEGDVGPERARAALAASGPLDWIVEAPGRVRLSARELDRLARAGVRWSALEPVRLVAVCAGPALARAVRRRRLLPPGAALWARPA